MPAIPGASFDITSTIQSLKRTLTELSTQYVKVGESASRGEKVSTQSFLSTQLQIAKLNLLIDQQKKLMKDLQKEYAVFQVVANVDDAKKSFERAQLQLSALKAELANPALPERRRNYLTPLVPKAEQNVQNAEANYVFTSNKAAAGAKQFAQAQLLSATATTQAKATIALYNRSLKETEKNTKQAAAGTMDLIDRTNIAIQKIITYRIAFGIYRQLTTSMAEAIQQTKDFNNVIQDLKKVIDPTQGSVAKLAESAFTLGEFYGKSATEVASTFSIFAQQGLQVNQILDRTNAVLKLSATSAITAADAVEALTAVLEAYPEFMDNATLAIDKWAAVQARAPSTTQDLAQAMMRVGIAAREVGITFDQFGGIVSSINEVTRRSGKEIGNSLKTMFANFSSDDSIQRLKRLGIAVLETQQTFRPVGDVIADINEKWDNFTNTQRIAVAQIIGDKRRYTDFIALMENYSRYVSSTIDSMTAQGEASRMLAFETEKYNKKIETLSTNISRLKITIGEQLMPYIIKFYTAMAKASIVLNQNMGAVKGLVTTAGILATAFGLVRIASHQVTGQIQKQIAAESALALVEAGASARSVAWAGRLATLSKALGWVGIAISALSIGALVYNLIKGSKASEDLEISMNKTAEGLKKWEEEQLKVVKSIKQTEEEIAKLAQMTKENNELQQIQDAIRYYRDYETVRADAVKKEKEARAEIEKAFAAYEQKPSTKTYSEYQKIRDAYTKIIDEANSFKRGDFEIIDNKAFPVRTVEERKKAVEELVKIETKRIKHLRSLITGDSDKFVPKTISDYLKRLYEIRAEFDATAGSVDNIVLALDEAKAGSLGDAFSPNEEVLRSLGSMYDSIVANRKEYETQIKLLQAMKKDKVFANDIESNSLKQQEELSKLLSETNSYTQKELELKTLLDKLSQQYLSRVIAVKQEQNNILITAEKTSAVYDVIIELNKMEGKGLQKLSSMRALDFVNLRKIVDEEQTVINLKEAQAVAQLNSERLANNQGKSLLGHEESLKYQLDLQKKLLEFQRERATVDIQVLANAVKYIHNIQSEVATAFSQAFIKMPDALTETSQTIKEINKERIEAEDDLKNARIKNDADATKEAEKRINDLKNKMKEAREDQIKAFTDIFGDVGNVAIKRWGEQLASAILTDKTASFLASGIVPAGLKTAEIWYSTILQAVADAQKVDGLSNSAFSIEDNGKGNTTMMIRSYNEAGELISETPMQLANVADNVGKKWEQALMVGGNLASVAIMKAFGIGVGEISNSLSNFGSMLGASAGEEWFKGAGSLLNLGSFAGPIGTLVGGLLGAGIGSLFESDPTPYIDKNTQALQSNTTAVENNNALLSMQNQFINAPSNYTPPAYYGAGGAGAGMSVSISINGAGSNANAIATEVVKQIDAAYANSAKNMQSKYSRFGR